MENISKLLIGELGGALDFLSAVTRTMCVLTVWEKG